MPDTETIEAPATQTETPPPAKPPVKPPTEAAPAEEGSSYLERIMGKKLPLPKKETPKPEPKKEAADVAPKEKAKPAAKPAAAKPIQTPPAEPPDYDKIAEAAGRGVAEAMSKKKDEPTKESGFRPKEKQTVEVLERMGKLYPDDAAIAAKYSESIRRTLEYQADWKKKNPGHAFDPEADEHNDFFEKNDVDWDDDHFKEAEDAIREDKSVARASEKLERKLKELEAKESFIADRPKIAVLQASAAKGFFNQFSVGDKNVPAQNEYDKVLDVRGNIDLTEVNRLIESDPIKEHVFQTAQNVEAFVEELYKLTPKDKHGELITYPFDVLKEELVKDKHGESVTIYTLDTQKHHDIAQIVAHVEAAVRDMTPSGQLDEHGRRFASLAEFKGMTDEKRKYYWALTAKELNTIYAANQANRVKDFIASEEVRIEKIAKARGYAKPQAPKPSDESKPVSETPRSPAGTVEPRTTQPAGDANGSGNIGVQRRLYG